MQWIKKSEKPGQPSKQSDRPSKLERIRVKLARRFDRTPAAQGTHPEGVNDGGGSQITLPDGGSGNQPSCASGAPTQASEDENGTTSLQIGERESGTPLDTPLDDQVDENAPDSHPDAGGPDGQNEDEDQRTAAERLLEATPEHAFDDDQLDESAYSLRLKDRGLKGTLAGTAGIAADFALGAAGAFGPLKAVLKVISSIYKNYQETSIVRKKIKDLKIRLGELEMIFGEPTEDGKEKSRRNGLLRKLKGIEKELWTLYEKSGAQKFLEHAQDNEDVTMLLDDLQEAINEYKMLQQMAIFEQGCKLIGAAETTVLNNFRSAEAAEFRHNDRNGCLKGTRGAVLDEIEQWRKDFNRPSVYWLNGLAGTGKTTIAQTIAERIFADGWLGASFFCSRDFSDRSNLRLIFPTLAVQLARKYPKFRSIFIRLVRPDPTIAHETLYNQMKKLIVEPLIKSSISTVIVIDALDECKDEEPASAILSVLGQFVSRLKTVKFFVTGRPEPRIRQGFYHPELAGETNVFVLHNVEKNQVDSDIRLFLKHEFSELAKRRVELDDWPTPKQLDLLCEQAEGLFVYAVATVKFIDSVYSSPKDQLNDLLISPESTTVGKTAFKPNTTLDSLYLSILQEAFRDSNPKGAQTVRSILGAVILVTDPLSPSAIATLLGLRTEAVSLILSLVHSLLLFQKGDGSIVRSFREDAGSPAKPFWEDVDSLVRPFHKSFPDFMTDPTRCTDDRFYIFPPSHHPGLLAGCLGLMSRTLERNIFKLPDAVINSEVGDLKERTEKCINLAPQYACMSWHRHLVGERTIHSPEVASTLYTFLEKKFLFWLEVLSVLGVSRRAVDALDVAAKWLETSPTLDLVNDCFRFVTGFFEVIKESAPHIYHSALPLSPRTSIVRKLYEKHAHPLTRFVHGLPDSWEPSIAAKTFPSSIVAVVWSPCSRFIAIVWDKSKATIEILDAVTLGRLVTLDSPLGETRRLILSRDARSLTWFSANPWRIISWDALAGVQVSAISPEQQGHTINSLSATYSTCGMMFGVVFGDGFTSTICAYNVHSGERIYSYSIEGLALDEIWTHNEWLRFATMKSGVITTWEVGFTATDAPTEVQSLPIPSESHTMGNFLLHPNLSRLAFITGGKVKVWDSLDSKFLLDSADAKRPRHMSCSRDGRFFACGTNGPEFYLWTETPSGYVLHQTFASNTGASKPLISPSGESIIAFGGLAIQLWRTTDSANLLSNVSARASQRGEGNFILGYSPGETLAAVTRMRGGTVTVLDLDSGTSRLIINTDMNVYGVGVGESTVVVVGEGRIVSWNIPGDRVLDPRANLNDNIRTTTFEHPLFPTFAPRPTTSVSPDLRRVAIVEVRGRTDSRLHLYDVHTGQCLASVPIEFETSPWFTTDANQILCVADSGEAESWRIVEESEPDGTELEQQESDGRPPDGFPWQPSREYDTAEGRWVLSSGGKRLLWLPPHWRSDGWNRMWSGRFLALLGEGLPEPVILELPSAED